jgi:hypothetical protein
VDRDILHIKVVFPDRRLLHVPGADDSGVVWTVQKVSADQPDEEAQEPPQDLVAKRRNGNLPL